jgi:3-deoxy-7-phosphoheptulonate synthase
VEGPSELRPGRPAVYGQSITDGCISLDQTEKVLEQLVRAHQVQKTALDSHIP